MTEYTTSADQGVRPADDQELKVLFQRVCQAWTDGDAAAYGACFTDDCDYVSFDGTRARGREQVIESHDKLFRGVLFGSALVGEVESIRYIADDVAVLQHVKRLYRKTDTSRHADLVKLVASYSSPLAN